MIARFPMTAEHFDLIEPAPVFASVKPGMRIEQLLGCGHAVAWVDTVRGEVLAIGGYVVRCPGVAWLWFLPSARGSAILLRVARVFKRWVASLEDGIRIEAHVRASFAEGLRWAELVGLQRETDEPIEKWDGRDDFHLYARVTGDSDGNS